MFYHWQHHPKSHKMEPINLGYSLKNIPVANYRTYMKVLIEKVESFIKRIRWKLLFHDKPELAGKGKITYGFKSPNNPEFQKDLAPFENDLHDLVLSVQFEPQRNSFQKQLKKDVRRIQDSPHLLVPADKTTNLYEVSKERYEKLLHESVTKTYRKADDNAKHDIDSEAKLIARKLELDDRIEVFAEREAFITLKDHKENFSSRPQTRLLNPAKSEIGIISKKKLAAINSALRDATEFNQWQSSKDVIEWFNKLPNKSSRKFLKFDIVEFYPSISEELLLKAIEWARSIVPIDSSTVEIIMHSRKSLLFSNGSTWTKKNGETFDVTMGSFDGAEVCELVGLYMLSQLCQVFPKEDMGVYRDDGLGAMEVSGPEGDRARKNVEQIFTENGLKAKVEALTPCTDHLDMNLDLSTGKFWPFRKPNSETLYVNTKSNHPPNVIKQIPESINRRISSLSCDSDTFDNAKPHYEQALRNSGHKPQFEFLEPTPATPLPNQADTPAAKKKRRRNVIWFNPPYNSNVTTDVCRRFIALINKNFPKGPPGSRKAQLRKLFNRNNLKCSYSCMPNMARIIKSHNTRILNPAPSPQSVRSCNCRNPGVNFENCPLKGNCLVEAVIYKATVTAPNKPTMHYIGSTEPPFKQRYSNHNTTFRHVRYRKSTELSNYMWRLKDEGVEGKISWEILQKCIPYKCGTRRCDVCLSEKFQIAQAMRADRTRILNKKSELVSSCRHQRKYRLGTCKELTGIT